MLRPLILAAMKRHPLGLSEFDLICEIRKDSDIFPDSYGGDNLKLFRTHFLLFNSLYRLRRELIAEASKTLQIGPLNINLRSFDGDFNTKALSDSADIKLEEYYLDMGNYEKTGLEDLRGMLDDFWRQYLAHSHRRQALQEFGLDDDAGWTQVQRRYRQLAALHHPDRGGSKELFQKLTAAKETLALCFGK
ncbi:MAG: DNA-J related domain-containing protein [bacterium]|nr:DNA-J related domain-containing protein [bacterium]